MTQTPYFMALPPIAISVKYSFDLSAGQTLELTKVEEFREKFEPFE